MKSASRAAGRTGCPGVGGNIIDIHGVNSRTGPIYSSPVVNFSIIKNGCMPPPRCSSCRAGCPGVGGNIIDIHGVYSRTTAIVSCPTVDFAVVEN